MTTPWSKTHNGEEHTLRTYADGDFNWKNWAQQIVIADESRKWLDALDNGCGLIDSDAFYNITDRPGHFVAGDIFRPHYFNLLQKLEESNLAPANNIETQEWGTDQSAGAVHNYEDRSAYEIAAADELFLEHWKEENGQMREEPVPEGEQVLGLLEERMVRQTEEKAMAEANRCMSCGMCFECDNCVIYCRARCGFSRKERQKHNRPIR